MEKIAFLLVISSSINAFADWVQVGSANDKKFTYFIDPSRIKVEGDVRNVWVLFNYKINESGIKSSVALNEYDCDSKKVRTNYLIQYSGEMATGETLMTSSPPKDQDYWRSVKTGTVTDAIMKAVCAYDGKTPILHS